MKVLSLLCSVLLAASVAVAESPLSFHEPFEKPGPGLSLVDGKIGKAVLPPATGIRLPTAGRLDKRQGTICLWVQPKWDGSKPANHGFVADEIDFNRTGDNNLYLWHWSTGSVRFDVRDPNGTHVTFDVKDWRANQWHHLAAAWDCNRGVWLFVDGRPVAHREATWKPHDASHFRIGSNFNGSSPANSAIDDFRIYNRVLDADLVALVMKDQPLPVVKYEKLIAPERGVEGEPFDVSLEIGDSKNLASDAKMSVTIDEFDLGTFPLGRAARVVVPRYLHLDSGQHKLRVKVVGSLADTDVPKREVTFEAPVRSSSPIWTEVDGKVLLNGKPLLKDGSGLFFEKEFYTGEAAWAKARELIGSGKIVDAVPCRLLDEVDCTTTSHEFKETSPSRLVELAPGKKFRVCGPREGVKETVRIYNGSERKALPAFSYRLRVTPQPTPHLLVVESINDTERNLEVVVSPAPGSKPSAVLAKTGPGSMQPNLAVICTGREFPVDGKPFRQTFLFYPKSDAVEVTISSSGREMKKNDAPGSAVSHIAVYELTRPLSELANPIDPPAKQRHLAMFRPSTNAFLREYGYSGATAEQRQASISEMFDYLHFLGFDRFEFHPYSFSRADYLRSTNRKETGKPDIFDDVLPIAEQAEISVVPRIDSLCFYVGDIWKNEPINYQLTKDGKVPDVFGKVPDPLRPPVQKLLLDMLGDMLRRCKGYKCVDGVGFRANAKFGILYVGSRWDMPPQESGYSKWDVEQFERDSGMKVSVSHDDPKACHEWLKTNAWEKWIGWRCEKMRQWWLQARDLAGSNGKQLFVRTIVPYSHHFPSDKTQWYGHKVPPLTMYRNHGFDPRLFHGDDGIITSEYFALGADRYNHARVHNRAFWHDPSLDGLIHTADGNEVELYYAYWELPDHPKGFAVSPSHMVGRAAFEPLTYALRTRNPYGLIFYNWHRATRGIDIELREFARAYRGLPAVEPRPFDGTCEPKGDERLWIRWFDDRLAVVNDSGQPRTVTLTIPSRDGKEVFDLATCRTVGVREEGKEQLSCTLDLRAYDLRTLVVR